MSNIHKGVTIDSMRTRIPRTLEYNRLVNAAHAALTHAIATGKLVKQPCEHCGSTQKIQGHHDDYTKPLNVTWLCFTCHRKEDTRLARLRTHPELAEKIREEREQWKENVRATWLWE